MNNTFNSSQYVGRNLLIDSEFLAYNSSLQKVDNSEYQLTTDYNGEGIVYPRIVNNIGKYTTLKKGVWYTLSFDIKYDRPIASKLEVLIAELTSLNRVSSTCIFSPSLQYIHISHTFKALQESTENTYFFVYVSEAGVSNVPKISCNIKNIKLEEGTQETPWCPAIEDCKLDFIQPNLINGTSNKWSSWYSPSEYGKNFGIPSMYIPTSFKKGDVTISLDVEFQDVQTDFDGVNGYLQFEGGQQLADETRYWFGLGLKSIYNSEYKIPDGIYSFKGFFKFDDPKYKDIINFDAGFTIRIDYWLTGKLRYRNVAIKYGDITNPIWTKSELDITNSNISTTSTANLLKNTNEGLTIKAQNESIEEYTFESNLSTSKARVSIPDICQVIDVDNQLVNKGVEINALTKDIELNKEIHCEKASTFSVMAKGSGKFSMHMIPREYKVGDEFQVTNEWTQYSIHDNQISDFTINLKVFKGSNIQFCAFKLEEGMYATEWCK